MATAAIVISIIWAVLSGGAVAYARRQTVANERLAEIEMARRHDEVAAIATAEEARRHARLRLYFEGSSTPKLIVRNDGPAAATDLTIEVVAAIGGDRRRQCWRGRRQSLFNRMTHGACWSHGQWATPQASCALFDGPTMLAGTMIGCEQCSPTHDHVTVASCT